MKSFGKWMALFGFMPSLYLVNRWRPAVAVLVFVGRWSVSVALVARVRFFKVNHSPDWDDPTEYAFSRIGIGPLEIEIERDWK